MLKIKNLNTIILHKIVKNESKILKLIQFYYYSDFDSKDYIFSFNYMLIYEKFNSKMLQFF
jgi:hypothetical protein